MRKPNKKGFTIVELVIVIAVVAILAAVLIPTFVNVVNKANVSNDTALVKNINLTLATEEIDGKPATMYEALEMAERGGFDVSKLTPRSSGEIVWDSATNRFALVDKDGNKVFSENDKNVPKNASVWKIVKSLDDAKNNTTYSSYIKGNDAKGTIEVSTGFDAGKNMGIETVTYKTDKPQNVVIRTNGGKLVVDAANSHVDHYYLANEVEVKAVSDSTYEEYGVVGKMSVKAGAKNVVVKSTAVVGEIAKEEGSSLTIDNGGFVAKKPDSTETAENISVSTYEQLQGLAMASTVGVELKTITLTSDIDLSGKAWQPFGYNELKPFTGTIDGGNHTIKGLSPNGYVSAVKVANTTNKNTGSAYGFITVAKDATVKNINFVDVNIDIADGLAVGVVVGNAYGSSLTIENVTVSGSVSGKDKIGGFVGLAGYINSEGFVLSIKNSTNNASVNAYCSDNYNRAGGFVGAMGGDKSSKSVTFENCINNGKVVATGNPTENTTDRKNYWSEATSIRALSQGIGVYAGQFVGQYNGVNTLVSTGNKANGSAVAMTMDGDTTYDLLRRVNKFGEKDAEWKTLETVNAENKGNYVYLPQS